MEGCKCNRRVVITGMGPLTSNGIGSGPFWASLTKGESGVRRITHFDPENFAAKIAAEVRDFDIANYANLFDAKEARRMDRFQQFAVAAAWLALKDASFEITEDNAERVGVIIASGIGGISTMSSSDQTLVEKGPRRVSPFSVPMMITDLAAGQVSITFGAKGPNFCITSACASSNHAIGEGFEIIRRGSADVMIVGGSESSVTPLGIASFCAARALSTRNDEPQKASRPFDKDRDGFVMGEGSGIIIIEERSHALARGAHIYAEIVGYGATADAYHVTQPDPEGKGAMRAMKLAIDQASISLTDVGYINAHGTSTDVGDIAETKAIKNLFGGHAYDLLVSSTKSMTGHLLGAAGAIELIATTLAIYHKEVPPTINLDNPDSECNLNYVPHRAVTKEIGYALSNSFGFGGHNASLAVAKYC